MKYGNRKSKLLCSSREIFLTTRKRTIKAKPELESSGRIILIDSFSPCADMEKDKKSAGLGVWFIVSTRSDGTAV
jgi:hypothetical protein